jgi:hypothetical protein
MFVDQVNKFLFFLYRQGQRSSVGKSKIKKENYTGAQNPERIPEKINDQEVPGLF